MKGPGVLSTWPSPPLFPKGIIKPATTMPWSTRYRRPCTPAHRRSPFPTVSALVPRACRYGIWEPFLTAARTYMNWARIAQAVAMELLREPTRRARHEWRGKPRQLLVDAGYRSMAGLRGRSRRRRNRPGGVPTGDGPALSPEMAPSKGILGPSSFSGRYQKP